MIHPVFDRDFDKELEQERARADHDARAIYTQEELDEAIARATEIGRDEGRIEGHAAGVDEARATLAAQQSAALAVLGPRMQALLDRSEQHRRALESQVLEFAISVCEKVLPEILRRRAHARAVGQIRRTLRIAFGSPFLRIYIAESALPALAPRIRQLAEAHELADRVDLQGDAALKDGDARVEWHNGFMEYSFGAVCDRILDALRASGRGDVEEISARGRHMNG
jgi:flagellar assembly protein FliH